MSNIITINYANRTHAKSSDVVYQYDYGQIINFTGITLPERFEVHLSNEKDGEASIQIGHDSALELPDAYLTSGNSVYGWIMLHTGDDDGETEYTFTIPVKKRAMPSEADIGEAGLHTVSNAVAVIQSVEEEILEETADIRNMSAVATTLAEGSSATASYSNGLLSLGIPRGNTGAAAGFGTVSATVDSNVGTPSVTVTASGSDTAKNFAFDFKNLKGDTGAAAGFGTVTATIDDNVGTPSVTVTTSGTDTAKNFDFAFENMKGDKGDKGDTGDINMAQLQAVLVKETASGSIASIDDGADSIPVIDLTADIEPIQDLHGYDAPWVGGAGKNKADISSAEVGTAWNGASNSARARLIIPCKASTTYTLSVNGTNNLDGINGAYSSSIPASAITIALNGTSVSFTTASDSAYITVGFNKSGITQNDLNALKLQVEEGSTKTAYEPYENICPISGHTDVVVSRTGKNLCDTSLVYNGYINVSQQKIASNANARTLYLPCKPNTTYTVSKQAGQRFVVAESTVIPTNDVVVSNIVSDYTASSITITTTASAQYLVAFVYLSTADTGVTADQMLATCQIELGSTATTYEPYQGDTYTTALGTTVYGGTLDVTTGVLTIDKAIVTYDGSGDESWAYYSVAQGNLFRMTQSDRKAGEIYLLGAYCNRFEVVRNADRTNGTMSSPTSGSEYALDFIYDACTTEAQWRTWLGSNNVQVVYPLATPTTVQLTAEEIDTLLGANNVWASSGDVEVKYCADTKMYIDNAIANL